MAVVEMDYGTSEGFKVTVDGKKVTMVLPDVCKYDQKWTLAKYKVVADLREALQANPIEYITHFTGDWTIRLIVAALAVEET